MAHTAPRPYWAPLKVVLVWVVVGWPAFAMGQPGGVSIVYHEPLANLRMAARADLSAFAKPAVVDESDLVFSAFGRDFELVLERNDRLIQRLRSMRPSAFEAIELYRGRIPGVAGSWARIARDGNRISGLIFDGVEYFAIDSIEHVADRLVMPSVNAEGAVIYRLYDTTGLVHDEVFEPDAPTDERAATQKNSILPSFMAGVVLGQQIDIGVVGDVEFTELEGASNVDDALLELINVVDGIFLEGLGVHINLVAIESFGAESDPFVSANPGQLLDELGGFKDSSTAFRSLGLLHLFTGRDLEDSSASSQTLGVANIGVLCEPRLGVGLTQARGGVADALVAAHEIGHNFGAPHDAQPGSACQAAPAGMLMDASLNGSTEFSQCSIEQMQVEIAGASCVAPLLPANLTLWLLSSAPPTIVEPEVAYEFDIAIENTSGVDAVDVSMVMNAPSMRVGASDFSGARPDDCDRPIINQPYRCYWSELAAGERFEATLFFRPTTSGPATVDLGITSLTEVDTSDDNLHFDLDVLPYVNLAAAIAPQALSLRPNEQGSVTITATNIGQISAHDVVVRVSPGSKLDFLGASVGSCVRDGDSYFVGYDCPIGTLAPGGLVELTVDFRPKPGLSPADLKAGASFGGSVSSLEPEQVIDRQDNSSSARVTMGDSIGDLAIEQFALPTAYVGETITAVVDVRNDGPDTIHDVLLELVAVVGSAQPTLTGLTGVSCALPTTDSVPFCEIQQLAAGEEVSLTFSIATSSTGDAYFSIGGATSSSDRNSFNDSDTSYIRVLTRPTPLPPPPSDPTPAAPVSSGGGGGGALDFLTLLFLGLLSAAAQRQTAVRRHAGSLVIARA